MTELALSLLKAFEGFKSKVYTDAVGFATIGYGHKLLTTERAHYEGRELTAREAEELLIADFEQHQVGVKTRLSSLPVTVDELEACTSLAFNIGVARFGTSTVLAELRQGHRVQAGRAFLMWNKAGGQVLAGLERRRHVESAWFLGAAPSTLHRLLEV